MKPEFWSSFRNPALLSSFPATAAGFNYENRFNISELGSRTAGLIVPAGQQALGMIYSHFGFTHFNRQAIGIACCTDLYESLSAGVQIDYFLEKTSGEYDNVQSLTFEGGIHKTFREYFRGNTYFQSCSKFNSKFYPHLSGQEPE